MKQMMRQAATACIQCSICSDLCPRNLIGHDVQPHLIMRNIWRQADVSDDVEFEKRFGSAANCCNCGACELFSCPMGLSPRMMNAHAKGLLRERGIQPKKNRHPRVRAGIDSHRIPTERLIARLDLASYVSCDLPELRALEPEEVMVPTSQHIGSPATPVVSLGDSVSCGSLIAAAAEGLSANIHTGFSGVVKEVTAQGIRIGRQEG